MKTMHLKLTSIFLMLGLFFSIEGMAAKADFLKTKEVNKSYKVGKNHELKIDNKFGEVNITTWDKNEIVVKIVMSVEAKSEKETIRRLDNIDVKIAEGNDQTSFETYFVNKKKNNSSGKSEMSINYEVKMPKSNALTLDHSFGSFTINDLSGKANIELKFGNAQVGHLSHPENDLRFEFADNVEITHLEKGKLTLKYSTLKLNAANDLSINSEFSNSSINGIGNLDLRIKFGSIHIEQVIKAKVVSSMSKIEIVELKEDGDFEPKYGSLTINTVDQGMKRLVIDGEFTPIDVNIEDGASFTAHVSGSMTSIKVPKEGWTKTEKKSNSISYEGSFGAASENILKVRSSFGNIKINF